MKIYKYLTGQIFFFALLFTAVTGLLWYSSASQEASADFAPKDIHSSDELIANRQLVELNADSLESLIHPAHFFTYAREKNKFVFRVKDGNDKGFRQFFFDGQSEADFKKIKNHGLNFMKDSESFEARIEYHNKVPYVILPVEIIQSILINR